MARNASEYKQKTLKLAKEYQIKLYMSRETYTELQRLRLRILETKNLKPGDYSLGLLVRECFDIGFKQLKEKYGA